NLLDDARELFDGIQGDEVHRAAWQIPRHESNAVSVDVEPEIVGAHGGPPSIGAFSARIGFSRAAHIGGFRSVAFDHAVDVRIMGALARGTGSDFEVDRVA